ncbi:MAG: ribbon-helix-helix domain-containing protein [Cyanobium sp.]
MAITPANLPLSFRSPRRVTVTLPLQTYEQLQLRCDSEGRSLSNLAAFLLEMALQASELRASGSQPGPAPRPRF